MNFRSECDLAEVIQHRPEQSAEVLNVCCEVTWPDGSTVALFPVRHHGALPTFLRALRHNGEWVLFDLRHVIPRAVEEIAQAQDRDQVGLVLYALRSATVNAMAFLARVDRHAIDRWPGDARPTGSAPAGKQRRALPGRASYHALPQHQPLEA